MVASAGLSEQTTGHMWPKTAANAAQPKIVAVPKMYEGFLVALWFYFIDV